MATSKTDREILECAADRLEKVGWIQHDYIDEDGKCCVLGALAMCADELVYGMPGWERSSTNSQP